MARKSFWLWTLIKKTTRAFVSLVGTQWFRLALIVLVVFASVSIQRSIYADPSLRVRYFDVQTTGILDHRKIVEWSGIKTGSSVFGIHLPNVRRRLLKHPEIKVAEIRRIMPNRIDIFISERQPLVQVAGKTEGPFLFMDEEGFVIPPPEARDAAAVPKLIIPELTRLTLERGARYNNARYAEIKTLLQAISYLPEAMRSSVAHVGMETEGHYTMTLRNEVTVLLQGDFSACLAKLAPFEEQLIQKDTDIEYIDARFTDIAIKRKGKHK